LIKEYLRSHEEAINDGLPFKYVVEAGGTLWDVALANTDQMGKEGELFTSLCTSEIFAVSIKMYQLQIGGNKLAPIMTHNFINGAQVGDQDDRARQAANVYISFRPGHYDGLIPGRGKYTPGKTAIERLRKQTEEKAYDVLGKQRTKGLTRAEIIKRVKQFAKGRGQQELTMKYLNNAAASKGNKTIEQVLGHYQEQIYGD
jgi:hypothetical protein